MLAKIREKTQGIIATIILGMIAIPFALWGVNSYFEGGPATNVAKVDGVKISQLDYRRALDQFRGQVKPDVLGSRQFKQMVLDGLVDQVLLVQRLHEAGFRVSDARLGQLIREAPYFQRDGRFDPELYRAVLQREGMTQADFESRLRQENLAEQLRAGLAQSVIVTDADKTAVLRLLVQQRRLAYVAVSPEPFNKKAHVTRQAIKDYYSAHKDAFKTPEQVRIEYIRLSASELAEGYQPTEQELRKLYEESGQFTTPAKRRASHILFSVPRDASAEQAQRALKKAEEVENQIRQGADFAALAKKYSDDPQSAAKGGNLGEITPGLLPRELDDAVSALKPGEVSAPVRTEYGYHLVKLTDYTPAKRKPYGEVRAKLVELARSRKGEGQFYDKSERLRNLVFEQPDSLGPAAKGLGLKIKHSDWFTRAGGSGIAADPKIVEAAFSFDVLENKHNSEAIELGADTLVVLRTAEHRAAAIKALSEVQAEIEQRLRHQQAREQAQQLSEEWIKQLNQGRSSLKDLAQRHGYAYHAPKFVTREESAGMNRRIVEAGFAAPRPGSGRTVYGILDLGSLGHGVYALSEVKEGNPEKADAELRERVQRELQRRRGAEYFTDYRSGLRQQADIKLYADQL